MSAAPCMDTLRTLAETVMARLCHHRPWLGLTVDDLIHVGWLHAASGRTTGSVYHAMRREAMRWLDGDLRAGVRVVALPAAFDPPAAMRDEAPTAGLDAGPLLARLTPDRRAVVRAIYGDGLTPRQAAAALNMPVTRVRALRYRSVEQLRAWGGQPSRAFVRDRARVASWHAIHRRARARGPVESIDPQPEPRV